MTPFTYYIPGCMLSSARVKVEVNYALPDRTLTISRPPRNRLPLVDFSYRPLFASLSVENILCVVGLLLTEAKARRR